MQELKTVVYRVEEKSGEEKSESWEHIRRFIVLEDLADFVRNASDNPAPYEYVYNQNLVNVDYMLITNTEHPSELDILNGFIKASGITNYYRTSYTKSKATKIQPAPSLTSTLKSEIGLIKPKCVIIFGSNISDYIYEDSVVQHEVVGNVMVTSSIISVLQSEKAMANRIKNVIWADFNKIKL